MMRLGGPALRQLANAQQNPVRFMCPYMCGDTRVLLRLCNHSVSNNHREP